MQETKNLHPACEPDEPVILNDIGYHRRMMAIFTPILYKRHIEYNFISCVFCRYLHKSGCHSNCFSCSRGRYDLCETLLPGIVAGSPPKNKMLESHGVPWLFKAPCPCFERLGKWNYLRNLSYGGMNTRTWNLEIVEGLFGGLSNGSTPCQICAAVNTDIFKECKESTYSFKSEPCKTILSRLYSWYRGSRNIE